MAASGTPPVQTSAVLRACLCALAVGCVQALVAHSRGDDFAGLHLKSIDINERSANDSEAYADLKYLPTNASAGLAEVDSAASDAVPAPSGIMSITNSDARDVSNASSATVPPNGTAAESNATNAGSKQNRSFDLYNHVLGVISLTQIFLLSLLVLLSRWDDIIALLTCVHKNGLPSKTNSDNQLENVNDEVLNSRSKLALQNSIRVLSQVKHPAQRDPVTGSGPNRTNVPFKEPNDEGQQSVGREDGGGRVPETSTPSKEKNHSDSDPNKLTISAFLHHFMPQDRSPKEESPAKVKSGTNDFTSEGVDLKSNEMSPSGIETSSGTISLTSPTSLPS